MDPYEAAAGRRSAVTATAPPVAQLFAGQQAALRELMSVMDADTRWVLLLGPQGSGKSTVVRALLDELRLAAATVAVVDARTTPEVDDLAASLRDQLGLPHRRRLFGGDHSVSDIVASQSELSKPLVVVVDDADALSSASMKWLVSLAARASRTETACYVVLAGTSELGDSAGEVWAKVGSGTSVQCVLAPMTSGEVRRYVEQWRHSRGDGWMKFSDAALERIEAYANGRPGVIGELCARAVTLPSARLTDEVSGDAVQETAERLGLRRPTGLPDAHEARRARGSRRSVAGVVALAIGTATLAALLGYVGLTRVGPRLMATAAAWLGWSVPADRSTSDVARSRQEGVRRAPAVAAWHVREAPPSPPPSTRPVPPPSAERRPRAVAVEPSAQQIAALMARARDGDVGELTRLVSAGISPNVRDVGGFTPLMAAVVNDRVPAARVLLDRGAEINARARGGITALMLGIINDRPHAVTLLLERGAQVNVQSGAGWTALTFAVWKGDADLVSTLMSHGAKPNLVDKQGWTPLDYAAPKPTPIDTSSDAGGGPERESSEVSARRPAQAR
jgi:type II secretory pathway predicted ATPase ExeA